MNRAWIFLMALAAPLAARADAVTLGNGYSGVASPSGAYLNLMFEGQPNMAIGGSVPQSSGTIGGASVAFSELFCVQLDVDVSTGTTYAATYNTNGTIDGGTAVNNAGQIAWLVENIGPTATTEDENLALQGAIWEVEYGSSLVYNGANEADGSADTAVTTYLNADLAALGSNTAPVSSLEWITPTNGDGSDAQGM